MLHPIPPSPSPWVRGGGVHLSLHLKGVRWCAETLPIRARRAAAFFGRGPVGLDSTQVVWQAFAVFAERRDWIWLDRLRL